MRGNTILRDQRNRLYQALRDQGAASLEALEESRKLDALVLRYYRTVTECRQAKAVPAETCKEGMKEAEPGYPDDSEIGSEIGSEIDPEIGSDKLDGEDPEP